MIWTLPGSAPARLRPRAASNASGALSRIASTRSYGWPTSEPLSRPTPRFPLSSPDTTPASARSRPSRAPPTAACLPASVRRTSSASVTGAQSVRTTSSGSRAVPSPSRLARSAAHMPAPESKSVSTWTAAPQCTTRALASPARAPSPPTCAPSPTVRPAKSPHRKHRQHPNPHTPDPGSHPSTTPGDGIVSLHQHRPSGHFHRTINGQNHRPATAILLHPRRPPPRPHSLARQDLLDRRRALHEIIVHHSVVELRRRRSLLFRGTQAQFQLLPRVRAPSAQ